MGRPAALTALVATDYPPEQRRLVDALNPFLKSTTAALGRNPQILVREFTVTMPSISVAATLGGLWVAQTPVGCTKTGNTVRLYGTATGGTYGTTALLNLPEAYAPDVLRLFTVAQSSLYQPAGQIQIFPSGAVVAPVITSVQSGVSTFLSLDGVSFDVGTAASAPGAPFPIALSTGDLKSVQGVEVWACHDVTTGSPVPAPYPALAWEPTAAGINLTNLVGLVPGRRYTLRLVLFA